jgi:hypothetical protein
MRFFLIAVVLLGTGAGLVAQKGTGHNYVSRMMYRIPDSLTQSTSGIAGYINATFTTQKDKSRALFIWIARNIRYNFDSIITNSIYETPSEVSERILRTRTGVCLNFAHLFNEIANKSGIKSFIVQGYTRQNGRVDYLPHIWCAAMIDTAWYLFDPTWGSGYYSKGRYVSQVNGYYCMTKPIDLIHSHIPFDPLWQFLNYPVTHHEFSRGRTRMNPAKPYFDYQDTLRTWEQASELEKAISAARRVEQNGVTNNFTEAKLRVLKGEIVFLHNKMAAEKYDFAVNQYNEGIRTFNAFINYWNNREGKGTDSLRLTRLLDSTTYRFTTALQMLDEIKNTDEKNLVSIMQLRNEINSTMMKVNLQRTSIYINDPK